MADARSADQVTQSGRSVPRVFLAVLAVGLALLVAGGVMFAVPQRSESSQEPRRQVQIVARVTDFVTEYNTYDAADLAGYQKRLDGLLTEGFAAENRKSTSMYFDLLKTKKQTSTDPKIKAVAVESSDADSANVLVVVDATISNTDLKAPEVRQMRWIVSVQKESGQWRVDAFQSVEAAPVGTPTTPAPTAPTPTDAADE